MAQMHSVTKRKEIIMKYKKLICILLTAVLLGGCIKEKPKKPAEENPDITITATPTNTVTPADDSEKDPLKEALAIRKVGGSGDYHYVFDTGKHKRGKRIIYHRLVVYRKKLL